MRSSLRWKRRTKGRRSSTNEIKIGRNRKGKQGVGTPGTVGMQILPEQDIDNSLQSKGAIAYKAVVDGEIEEKNSLRF